MPYVITLKHVRYGRQTLDLAELKRRLEMRIAIGRDVQPLRVLRTHVERVMALLDIAETGRDSRELRARMNTELAFLLLSFDQVQAIMRGVPRRPAALAAQPALPKPAKKRP